MRIDHDTVLAHRVAYFIATGVDPGEACVCHTCDNRRCIKPEHLFLGSYADNNQDMFAKGRGYKFDGSQVRGTKNVNAKLSPEAVAEILASPSASLVELARRYGVTKQAIWYVRHGKTWGHQGGERG